MEFIVSEKELNRRKKAFATLLASMTAGIFLFSYLFHLPLSLVFYLPILPISLFFYYLTLQYLNSLSQVKIHILNEEIEREKGSIIEKYDISKIETFKIKRRTDGKIREMYLSFTNGRHLYISAFEEKFEKLKDILLGEISNKVSVKEIHEPLNYDNPMFYAVLGLFISCFTIFFMEQILKANFYTIRAIQLFFSIYPLYLAAYFVIKKPTSVRACRNQTVVDYIFGIVLLILGILIII